MRLRALAPFVAMLPAAVGGTADAQAGEWKRSGLVAVEARGFPGEPAREGQLEGIQGSLLFQPEVRYRSSDERHILALSPFLRLDGEDGERTHGDLRVASWRMIGESWEVLAGADRVFWGVTESRHLVDVINQVDAVEDVDEEDRLGQPMVAVTLLPDWGALSFYALAGFRERTFPGREGRLRGPLAVDTSSAVYESGARDARIDAALRYAHALGDWDVGAHLFSGTSREPRLVPGAGGSSLVPHYDLMNQAGLDLQYTRDAWLWKLEAIARKTRHDDFGAFVAGLEYTLFQIGETAADLGLLVEYLRDARDEEDSPATLFEDDVFVGSRLAFNDLQDTEILCGLVLDRDRGSKAIFVEADRRLGSSWSLELEGRFFADVDEEDPMTFLRSDDFVTLRLAWNL